MRVSCRKRELLYILIVIAFLLLIKLFSSGEYFWKLKTRHKEWTSTELVSGFPIDSALSHGVVETTPTSVSPVLPNSHEKQSQLISVFSKGRQRSNSTSVIVNQEQQIVQVLKSIEDCMQTSSFGQNTTILLKAKRNARFFFNEYRKVIPKNSLSEHFNHCWHTDYDISLGDQPRKVKGHIGEIGFEHTLGDEWFTETPLHTLQDMGGKFASNNVCLPNIYILGVPKCGTTFLWCFVSKVLSASSISKSTDVSNSYNYEKEPHFWTPYPYIYSTPKASQIGSRYLLNFIKKRHTSVEELRKDVLIDGSPNMVLEWPRFTEQETDVTNYCLLPSTMPHLLPESKFIVILRNPVSALYSAFWWSLNFLPAKDRSDVIKHKYDGPNIFHERIVAKITRFNSCMRDLTNPDLSHVCTLTGKDGSSNYSTCIRDRFHLLSNCVYRITVHREPYQTVLHKTIYYPHIFKWLSVVPKDRLVVTTMENLLDNPLAIAEKLIHITKIRTDAKIPLNKTFVEQVTSSCSSNPQLVVDYKRNKRLRMREDTKTLLEEFFHPFNTKLSELFKDSQFIWS